MRFSRAAMHSSPAAMTSSKELRQVWDRFGSDAKLMMGSSSSDEGDFGEWKVAALRKVISISAVGRHWVRLVEDKGWSEGLGGDVLLKARRRGCNRVEAI